MTSPLTYLRWLAVVCIFGFSFSFGLSVRPDRTTIPRVALAQQSLLGKSAAMHLRVLTYDRNMASRGGKEQVTIGMAYNPESESSEREARNMGGAIAQAAATTQLNGRQVNVVLVPWSGDSMGEAVHGQGVSVLYVASGTWEQLDDIKDVAAMLKMPTMTGSRSLVKNGIGVGVINTGSKIEIVINRKAAETNGMRLDARIYKHSELL